MAITSLLLQLGETVTSIRVPLFRFPVLLTKQGKGQYKSPFPFRRRFPIKHICNPYCIWFPIKHICNPYCIWFPIQQGKRKIRSINKKRCAELFSYLKIFQRLSKTTDYKTKDSQTLKPIYNHVTTEENKKILTLKTNDNETFEIKEAVAIKSRKINYMVEDGVADNNAITMTNVDGRTLAKFIEYLIKHVDDNESMSAEDKKKLKEFDQEFVNVEQGMLFNIILAANYMDIPTLLDLTCQTVADMIKGKTVEEIRATFNIKNDFTPEEEAEIRKDSQWAFED